MKKILTILACIAILALVIWLFGFLWMKSQPKEVLYNIVEVGRGNIERTTVVTGSVSPRDEVLIKPQISGIVSEVLKEAGQPVKAGEIIAVIQVVPESSSLSSAESQLNLANIEFNKVQAEYDRQKGLFTKGVISASDMDEATANYLKALEDVSNAKDNLDIVRTGVSEKTAKYSNTQIKSTIDGMILDIPIKVGNSVIQANNFNEGTTIATIANMSDMIFVGKVDETEVGRMHTGMKIKLSIGAIEDKKFDAILEYISPKGTEENGAILFEIKAAAKLSDNIDVRAGYSSNGEIVIADAHGVLVVPESSLSFSNDSAFVYKLSEERPKQVFEKTVVKTGLSDGINIEIKSGLKEGEKIRGTEIHDTP